MCIRAIPHERPFPAPCRQNVVSRNEINDTYHLESVQLLLNLLGKQWSQTIASSNVTLAIVFTACPCLVESDPWAENNLVLWMHLGGDWRTVGPGSIRKLWFGKRIVLAVNIDRLRLLFAIR